MLAKGSEDNHEPLPGKGLLLAFGGIVITALIQQNKFFAEGGWWATATGQQQLIFGLVIVLLLLVAFLFLAGLAALFSKRWREQFWKPKLIRFPLRVIRTSTYNELKARPKTVTPRPGMRVSIPGLTRYGELETHLQMNNRRLRVQWSNGTVIGELRPTNGNAYRVVYGRLDDSRVSREFQDDEDLGRADNPSAGVEMLRIRDLQEAEKAEKE